jgi:hypothetical protein
VANQYYWSTSWVSNEGGEMAPGAAHYWWANPFSFGDAITVTAQAVTGDPNDAHRTLEVQDVRVDGTPDGLRTLFFTVRNVGSGFIPGYIVGSSVVNT